MLRWTTKATTPPASSADLQQLKKEAHARPRIIVKVSSERTCDVPHSADGQAHDPKLSCERPIIAEYGVLQNPRRRQDLWQAGFRQAQEARRQPRQTARHSKLRRGWVEGGKNGRSMSGWWIARGLNGCLGRVPATGWHREQDKATAERPPQTFPQKAYCIWPWHSGIVRPVAAHGKWAVVTFGG